jgi:septum formation topological specificity factor MinE
MVKVLIYHVENGEPVKGMRLEGLQNIRVSDDEKTIYHSTGSCEGIKGSLLILPDDVDFDSSFLDLRRRAYSISLFKGDNLMDSFKQMLEMVQGMNNFQVQQTMETDAKTEVLQVVCDYVMSAIEGMQLTIDEQAKRIEALEQGKPITAVGKGV